MSLIGGLKAKVPLLTLIGVFAGCSAPPSEFSDAKRNCGNDYDCPGDELCINNICLGSCKHDTDCPGNLVCENNLCVGGKKGVIGETSVKSGTTDSQGMALFHDEQSNELVEVFVNDSGSARIPNAPVIFYDGNGVEVYQSKNEHYSFFHIFSHNSRQLLSLTSNSMQPHHYTGTSKENSSDAARKFSEIIKSNSASSDCISSEEALIELNGRINAIIDLTGYVPKVGEDVKHIVTFARKAAVDAPIYIVKELEQRGIIPSDGCQSFKTYNTPMERWNISPDFSFYMFECLPNSCDNPAEGEGEEEQCPQNSIFRCLNGDVYRSCGGEDYLIRECADSEYCNEDDPDCLPRGGEGEGEGPKRWVDQGDGTMLDTMRRLVWQQAGSVDRYSHSHPSRVVSYCNRLELANKSWRAPTQDELSMLLRGSSNDAGCYISNEFEGPCGKYWARMEDDLCNRLPNPTAQYIDFSTGEVGQGRCTESHYVRCVVQE